MSKAILTIIVIVLISIAVWFFTIIYGLYNPKSQTNQNQTSSITTSNIQGIKVEVFRQGRGNGAKIGDLLTVNYIGMLEDGTKFDSSYDRKVTFDFKLGEGRVIKGWDIGLIEMKVGEKRRLTIPSELAYGASGFSAAGIPENATLIFEIELLFIN